MKNRTSRWVGALAAVTMAVGCGDDGPIQASGSEATDTTEGSTGETGGGDFRHGFVKVELRASENADMPYVGTATMSITVDYLTCLSQFYESTPDWAQDGILGAPVFDEWQGRLCSEDVPGRIDCEVLSISQSLADTKFHRIEYSVDQQDIERGVVLVGPLPSASLADCETSSPQVRLFPSQATGDDAAGNQIWFGQSVNPDIAETNQGMAMALRATNAD